MPDTRRTHADKLIRGTNFAPEAGKMAILSYNVHITNPGKYYVWVRAFSTGSEDNGLHVGIDGTWPASGQRLQWCDGKKSWRWDSKQRTEKQHCGEPHKIYLEIDEPGDHVIHFSMREDGFEFDKWFMTTDRDFQRPEGKGPTSNVHAGTLPKAFPTVKTKGNAAQAPGGSPSRSFAMTASTFVLDGTGYYLDQGKWAAINPDQRQTATAGKTFGYPTGNYDLTLQAVGENDGQSTYIVKADDATIGEFKTPISTEMFEEGAKFHKTWKNVSITEGTVIRVQSTIGSADGAEFSRARWKAVTFTPADQATRKLAGPIMDRETKSKPNDKTRQQGSPTKNVSNQPLIMPRQSNGSGQVRVLGETKQWHKITIDLDGPFAHEQDNSPNPFTDMRMTVNFQHSDATQYHIPGYFCADGDAANSSAESGTHWRAHFAPDRIGVWTYTIQFDQGKLVALDPDVKGNAVSPFDGITGTFAVAKSDKTGRDLRGKGRLQYVGNRYLQFAGSDEYFLKAGADAPETLLAYRDFDNTIDGNPKRSPIKSWSPHVQDWQAGDPTWKGDKGKGLIGAVNYLSGKGCNAFSFLTYNAGGDGNNVWPFIHRDDKLHYDCSKLDQWGIVMDHATAVGMYLHFKMQETENDDHRKGKKSFVPECLDGGNLGRQRKLYCRELIARFGHNLALNWNLGEENTQTTQQQTAMLNYIADLDAYNHNIVIHTFPGEQDKVYRPQLGPDSKMTGVSLQNSGIQDTHVQTVKWVRESTDAGKPWVVAFDESGTAALGQCPDLGYQGFDGKDRTGKMAYTQHEVRRQTLWGTIMGGGAGVEYYFGYQFAENDLVCEDWRSRDQSWGYCRIALDFFRDQKIPFEQTVPADELVGNPDHNNDKYCLAVPGSLCLVYLPKGGQTMLDLSDATGEFTWSRLNPRTGDYQTPVDKAKITGGKQVTVSADQEGEEDWLIVLRKAD